MRKQVEEFIVIPWVMAGYVDCKDIVLVLSATLVVYGVELSVISNRMELQTVSFGIYGRCG